VKLILTNDDGLDAPGLYALGAAAESVGECVTIAPAGPASGISHAVTTDRSIRIYRRSADRIAVEGTPADCVRLGLHRLAPQADWVLSGINAGGNLGADIHHSGTVAAVREAVLHGRRGIAVSYYRRRGMDFSWDEAVAWVKPLLADLIARPAEPGTFWNINLPHLPAKSPRPETVFCDVDPSPLPINFRENDEGFLYNGVYHDRRRVPGCDVDVCFAGKIAVSRVRVF
jgi:5'-nucleotidase